MGSQLQAHSWSAATALGDTRVGIKTRVREPEAKREFSKWNTCNQHTTCRALHQFKGFPVWGKEGRGDPSGTALMRAGQAAQDSRRAREQGRPRRA